MSQTNYSRRLRKTIWLAFLLPFAIAVPAAYMLRHVVPGEQFWLVLSVGLAVMAATLWAGVPWWRTMDDMQRHGQMISWHWGGMAGGLAMLVWLIAAHGMPSDEVKAAMALFGGQAAGFLVFWLVWMWQRQRGAAE